MSSVVDWPTTAQVARQLGVTPDRVRELAKDGRIDSVRTGLGRLLDPESVERLVAERSERRAVVA